MRVSPAWLALREPADAAARSPELVEPIRRRMAASGRTHIYDLGAGTGSMGRWLAPRLPGPQHWVLYDRDTDLLDRATIPAAIPATHETRRADITRLEPGDLDGAALVTGSALLDMLTADELDRLAAACATVLTLLTISVIGRVELTPSDPLDADLAAAFNAHQRRTVDGRTLSGPDAVDAAVGAFERQGATVVVRPSPWRLGAGDNALIAEWLDGWLSAACEQRPELTGPVAAYRIRRRADLAAGSLRVVVHHRDLLAEPRTP